jgi:hypothetical protein
MPPAGSVAIMPAMSVSSDLNRRVLIPIARPPSSSAKPPPVRHYRLARLPLYTRPDPTTDRFAHLRRGYD